MKNEELGRAARLLAALAELRHLDATGVEDGEIRIAFVRVTTRPVSREVTEEVDGQLVTKSVEVQEAWAENFTYSLHLPGPVLASVIEGIDANVTSELEGVGVKVDAKAKKG